MVMYSLKCFTGIFAKFASGGRRADVRTIDDVNFAEGDIVTYREGEPDVKEGYKYTGRWMTFEITDVSSECLPKGQVLLSLKFVEGDLYGVSTK